MQEPWILFEAGALSKSLDESRVIPLLIGLRNADLKGPLSHFNTAGINKSEFWKLIDSINKHKSNPLPDAVLGKAFGKWWPDLENSLSAAAEKAVQFDAEAAIPARDQRELLSEILEISRSIAGQLSKVTRREWGPLPDWMSHHGVPMPSFEKNRLDPTVEKLLESSFRDRKKEDETT